MNVFQLWSSTSHLYYVRCKIYGSYCGEYWNYRLVEGLITLKMEIADSSETLLRIYLVTRHYILNDRNACYLFPFYPYFMLVIGIQVHVLLWQPVEFYEEGI
jgi:hypothetical protein